MSWLLHLTPTTLQAPTVAGDATTVKSRSSVLNPVNMTGLLLGTAAAGVVVMQKKNSEVRLHAT